MLKQQSKCFILAEMGDVITTGLALFVLHPNVWEANPIAQSGMGVAILFKAIVTVIVVFCFQKVSFSSTWLWIIVAIAAFPVAWNSFWIIAGL